MRPGGSSCPGGVDAHTHLHLHVGAAEVSDDFGSGTAAAAVGGTTTVIEYVTTTRGQRPLDALAAWQREAEPAAIDYGFHMTLVEATTEADVADCVERGITSFKLYMAYPETLQVDDDVIVDVLRHTGKHGGLVTVHAENGGAITSLRREALLEGRTGVHRALAHPPGGRRGRGHGARRGAGRAGRGARSTSCTSARRRRWPPSAPRRSGASRSWARPARSTSTST